MKQHLKTITENSKFTKYRPLIIILLVSLAATGAISLNSLTSFMHIFMGMFFVLFSLFKFFDIHGFVKGFAMYDLVTKKIPGYGYAYPFIELALGLLYLSDAIPVLTDLFTIAFMFISAAGVINSLSKGQDLRGSCIATTLNIPLSTVTIIENLGMGGMAIYSLIF